jgi:hypothetical protein
MTGLMLAAIVHSISLEYNGIGGAPRTVGVCVYWSTSDHFYHSCMIRMKSIKLMVLLLRWSPQIAGTPWMEA